MTQSEEEATKCHQMEKANFVEKLKTSKFSIQPDGSTESDNRAIIMAHVRFINDSCRLCEELLFAKLL